MSAPITWTPAVSIIGVATAEVALVPSLGGMRPFRVVSFDRETRDRVTAETLLTLFREVRADPPRECLEIARSMWAAIDTREKPKPT